MLSPKRIHFDPQTIIPGYAPEQPPCLVFPETAPEILKLLTWSNSEIVRWLSKKQN